MKVKDIHHIGIAVRNLEESLGKWSTLFGVGPALIEEIPDRRVRLAHLRVAKGPEIELVAPFGADSPVDRFLESRGEGIHHFAVEVEDIEAAMDEIRRAGLKLVSDTPQKGSGGALVAFVHPQSIDGVLVEIRQGRKARTKKR